MSQGSSSALEDAPRAYDASLLEELLDTVIPNLEQFPTMGRPFLARAFAAQSCMQETRGYNIRFIV
jgi:hypothetical protein